MSDSKHNTGGISKPYVPPVPHHWFFMFLNSSKAVSLQFVNTTKQAQYSNNTEKVFVWDKHIFSGLLVMNSNNHGIKYNRGFLWQSPNIKSEFISIPKQQPLPLINSGKHPLCQIALIEGFPFSWMVCYRFIPIGLRWSYYGTANHLHWDAKIALCLSLGPTKLCLIWLASVRS